MEGRSGAWRLQQQQRGPGAPVAGLPIGFRFRPTDEELLLHYLRRKALACPLPAGVIPDADLARLHPWDLLPAAVQGMYPSVCHTHCPSSTPFAPLA
jgi:hypothetical protein